MYLTTVWRRWSLACRDTGERGKWTYDHLQSPEIDSRIEYVIRYGIGLLIVLNVVAVMASTVDAVAVEYGDALYTFELISVIIFSLEYLLRLWAVVEDPRYQHPIFGRLRYSITFFALVDLLAILPFYLPMFVRVDLRTLRVLRLLRLARLVKLGRYSTALGTFTSVLRNKREQLLVSMAILLLLVIVSSTAIYYLEHDHQPEAFSSIPAALWWGIVTLTTIGYGDIYPITVGGKIFAAIISVISIGMVAFPSGIIVAGFEEAVDRRKEEEQSTPGLCPHCGEPIESGA